MSSHREQIIQDTKRRLTNDNYSRYHVKAFKFTNIAITHCPACGEDLIFVRRVELNNNNRRLSVSGNCCVRCNTVYLKESLKKAILGESVSEVVTPPKATTVLKSSPPENLSLDPQVNDGILPTVISSSKMVPTEITTVTMYNTAGKEYRLTIVDDAKFQDSKNGIYWRDRSVSQSILRALLIEKPWVLFKNTPCRIATYTTTDYLTDFLNNVNNFSDGVRSHTIWIYRGKIPCPDHEEQTESVTVYVPSVKDPELNALNVNYCKTCNKYYINSESFNIYARKYGMPQIHLSSGGGSEFGDFSTWQEESLLHFLGYNVSSTEGLSNTERQQILSEAIDAKFLSKAKVVTFLEGLIRRNKDIVKMDNAVAKWRLDLKFVLNYKISEQRKIQGHFMVRR